MLSWAPLSHASDPQTRLPCRRATDGTTRAGLRPLVFRVDDSTPQVVQSVLLERGWDKFDHREQDVEGWNLYWRTSSFRMAEHITSIFPPSALEVTDAASSCCFCYLSDLLLLLLQLS